MIDLPAVRALAERAKADDHDGLTAREQLPAIVLALLDMLGGPRTEWGAAYSTDQGDGVLPRDGEQDAREFIAGMPARVRHLWHVTRRTVYLHEGPWVEVPDA